MSSAAQTTSVIRRHHSPPLGLVAIIFTVLFCAGLYPVTAFGGKPYFPGPGESAQTIVAFFQARPSAVLLCAFLQFGSAIPLGIFTASAVSRLKFLGVRAAGADIALFGGFGTAFMMMTNACVLWTMAQPEISQASVVTLALYRLAFGLGGPGYSVSLGLLMAGISVPVYFRKLAPRWIPILGLVLALVGELSWLNIEFPQALLLIPLTRFPGFIWMIAMGFALPATAAQQVEGGLG
ncbi:MAG: hypothetical protein WB679_18435 [Terracidiphilus sp.]